MSHKLQRISAQSGKMNQLGSKILMLAPLIIVLLLCHFDKSQAASSFDCCLQYTERPVHVKLIKSYEEQWSYEACDIDAIIFYTKRFIVCADPKEGWVKHNLRVLRARNKKMAKSN